VKPVYHAGLLDFIIKILRCVCAQCSKLLLDKELIHLILKIKNKEGRLKTVGKHCIGVKECKLEAEGCSMKQPKYS
jgi:DNA-directed RNA polymerase II subunit RPB1